MTLYFSMSLILLSIFATTLFTAILLFIPIMSTPSYEATMALNIFILLFYTYISRRLQRIFLIEEFVSTIFNVCLVLFIIPFIILIISGLFKGFCPSYQGFLFYLIDIPPLLLLLSSISLILRRLELRSRTVWIVFTVIILLSLALNIYTLLSQPTVRFYSTIWGFFSGPVYDEDVRPDRQLILYKAFSTLIALIIWLTLYRRNGYKTLISILLLIPTIIIAKELYQNEPTRSRIYHHLGGKINTEHFEIIYPLDQEWSRDIDVLAELHEYYYALIKRDLNHKGDMKIRSYIFRNEEEKQELTGAGRTQIAKPWLNEIYITPVSLTDAKLKHEISHIIVGSLIDSPLGLYGGLRGLIPNMAVVEGISVALEPETNILTLHQKAAILLKENRLPHFTNLFDISRFYSYSGILSYSTAGSFIKYLIDTYGIDKFKRILSYEDFKEVYGKDIDKVEKEYREFLNGIVVNPSQSYWASVIYRSKGLVEKKCPHEVASLKNRLIEFNKRGISTESIDTGEEILKYCEEDSEVIIELIKAYINRRDYDKALNLAEKYLPYMNNAYYYTLLLDMISDIHIFKGDLKEAIMVIQDQIMKIPDSDSRRNLEMKRFLYENGEIELLKKFYSIEKAPTTRAGILSNKIATENSLMSYYLFGRLLFNARDYENSKHYLIRFLDNTLKEAMYPDSIKLEAAIMLLSSSIFTKDYNLANHIAEELEQTPILKTNSNPYHIRRYLHIKDFLSYLTRK